MIETYWIGMGVIAFSGLFLALVVHFYSGSRIIAFKCERCGQRMFALNVSRMASWCMEHHFWVCPLRVPSKSKRGVR